ncbi:rare lipoprotein A [Thalassoporum mexicanum PCC 7367]|uniref:septal ring lytic transglycosylase RlpA family protein n=1 Tax=Thalassoporum mexicanum TaxID=3457544 RepID=UPI00029FC6F3|nr:septal ring lytic transglycosylase RlpA family protein [Pseudanabaena sp. PCC 7367]AFY68996.1 rare lipoprotein A [Pseudanabaena sp. PCC 7367]
MLLSLLSVAYLDIALATDTVQADEIKAQTKAEQSTTKVSSAVKIGETRSQSMARLQADAIAKVYPHKMQESAAATVQVSNIPVLTFLGTSKVADASNALQVDSQSASKSVKLPSLADEPIEVIVDSSDPVKRATAIAAMINQLHMEGIDPEKIVPAYENGRYVIKLGDDQVIEFDQNVLLPDTTNNRQQDVLQAANRLRRLMGGAAPVNTVAGAPKPKKPTIAANLISRVARTDTGMASWYGPGFNGRQSASGEIFNQNALTAAHRTLPFGTKVKVTNVHNGQSVVVRINDRGPFSGGRIIDLSKAAAGAIGLIRSGVAPVKVEVLVRDALGR